MPRKLVARKTDMVLRGVQPNAGIEAAYRRKMQALITEMDKSVVYWLCAPSKTRLVLAARPGLLGITTRRRALEEIDGRTTVPVARPFPFELDSFERALCVVQWGRRSGWYGLNIDENVIVLEGSRKHTNNPSVLIIEA